jgi:hypothetical protein
MNKKLFSMTVLCLLASCLAFVSCGSDSSGESYDSVTYTSKSAGTTYELVITKNTGKAAFTPGKGDHFTMTITKAGGNPLISSGSVDLYTGGIFTLLPESGESFKVTAGASGMTKIEGTITFNDGTTEKAPTATLTPDLPDGGDEGGKDPNSNDIKLDGTTWKGEGNYNGRVYVGVIRFTTASDFTISWTWKDDGTNAGNDPGTYTVQGHNVTLTWTSNDVATFIINNDRFVLDGVTFVKQ